MENTLTNLSFHDWVPYVFDHEVGGPEWYFDIKVSHWQGSPAVVVAYLTQLFEDPLTSVGSYSDEQLSQGFWYVASNGASDYMFAVLNEQVPLEARLRCIRSFVDLFQKLFAVRCSPHLSHLDEPGANPLNVTCYMWWDILPIGGQPDVASRREIDEACLQVMEQGLNLESIACQESSLHGLGHWQHQYPQRVDQVIDPFLAAHPNLRPELLGYAKSARRGCVQ